MRPCVKPDAIRRGGPRGRAEEISMTKQTAAPARRPEVPPTADDPAESQRFIDMARELGVDESPEAFDRAFARVVPPPKPATGPKKTKATP